MHGRDGNDDCFVMFWQVTPSEYCSVARAHSARLTDDQCKEIIRLMDEGE